MRAIHHRFRPDVRTEVRERPPLEFDHELAETGRTGLAGLTAATHSGGHGSGDAACRIGLVREPVQPVTISERGARHRRRLRDPEHPDIVVDLVVGRYLDALDRTAAPVHQWLHPEARPTLISNAVEIVLRIAIALKETETPRVLVRKGGRAGDCRVVKRPPDPLAGASIHRQPVGIVNFRPPVLETLASVLGEPEHGGERRYAEPSDVSPQKQD